MYTQTHAHNTVKSQAIYSHTQHTNTHIAPEYACV